MSKKTQILLNKKHKLLTSFLDDAKKINDLVPLVQEAKEETELSIAAIGDAPSEVANSFDDSYIYGTVESDYTLWEKSLPKISIISPFYVTASGSAASATTSDVVFSQINSLNNPSQPPEEWIERFNKFVKMAYQGPDCPPRYYVSEEADTLIDFIRQEITNLVTTLRAEVEEYFGHIANDGSGKPMNVSQDEIARDVLSIIKKYKEKK